MVSKRFASELREEVPKLIDDKIISKPQGEKILSRYSDVGEEHDVVSIVATFGAILVGLGILTLVALNWDAIPDLVRVLLLLASTIGAYWVGHELRFKRAFPKVGSSLIFLGATLVGVSIVLIAQTYNLHSDSGHWLLLWTIGVVPAAYLLGSASSLGLGLLTFTYWFGTQFARLATERSSWWSDDAIWRLFEVWPLTVVVFFALGIAYWAIGALHEASERAKPFAAVYQVAGAFFLLFNAYMLTFRWLHGWFWSSTEFSQISSYAFVLLWALAALGIGLLAYAAQRTGDRRTLWATAALGLFAILAIVSVTFPQLHDGDMYGSYGLDYYDRPLFTPFSLVMNVLFLALLVGVAWLGLVRRDAYLVNLALLFFGVSVFTRYVEFFWDRLSGGFFFIVTGLILILLAVSLEKARRKIMGEMATAQGKSAVRR